MLEVAIKSAGMHGLFDHVLSVDAVRKYKTSADAYALAPAAFECPAERILFVTSNGWDAAGAAGSASPPSGSTAAASPWSAGRAPTVQGSLLTDVVDFGAPPRLPSTVFNLPQEPP
jgi:2-haloacid dehalogenase